MHVELALVLVVALLYGPTVLWMGYRTLRGHRGRLPSSGVSEQFASTQLVPGEVASPEDPDGYWACGGCRSLNRRESSRCYRCRMAKDADGLPAPGVPTASGWVPVMASDIPGSPGDAATPVIAVPALSTPKVSVPVIRVGEQAPATAPPAASTGATACPFLGLRNDPSTRYDFADAGNACRPAGTTRSQPIDLEHQRSRCLTAAHAQCARYRAVEVTVSANL